MQKPSKNSGRQRGAHFNEANLRETNHPVDKDYGFLSINESKTPYPRKGDPVDASQLRERLMAASKNTINSLSYIPSDIELSSVELSESMNSVDTRDTGESFYTKRKRFYASEFLIAKQRLLSNEMHQPGESVASSTRYSEIHSPFEGRRFTR